MISGLAAAVFAVHPLRVEAVAWASCQPYLPSVGFALLSVLAYVRSCVGGPIRPGWRFASVVLYAVALGFKAVTIGMPLVLLVLDLSVLGRRGAGRSLGALLVEKVPYLIPAIAASAMAIHAKSLVPPSPSPPRRPREDGGAAGRGGRLQPGLLPGGDGLAVRPVGVPLPAGSDRAGRTPPFAGRLAAAAVLGAVVYRLRRRCPGIPAALLAYAILQAPNLGLVPYGLMLVADRYAYLATMPLFVAAAAGLVDRVAGSRRPTAVAAPIVAVGLGLVAVLASMSLSLSRTWRDSRRSGLAPGGRLGPRRAAGE